MGLRQRRGSRGPLILAVTSVLTAAFVAAQPASANGNGNAYGQTKHDPAPPPPPPAPTATDTILGGSSTSGQAPNAPAVNSFTATSAFYNSGGGRVAPTGPAAVKAVVTITNTSTTATNNTIGSVRFTVPTTTFMPCAQCPVLNPQGGYQVSFLGGSLSVRGLDSSHTIAPNTSLAISFWMQPVGACDVTALAWVVRAWTSTGFSGSGFAGGPTTALGSLRFTGNTLPVATAYNAAMSPAPQVASFDACGSAITPPTIALTDQNTPNRVASGYTQSSSNGVATLSGVTFNGFDYTDRLTANAVGFTSSDPSSLFLVAEKVQPCNSSSCQPLNLDSQRNTAALITPVFAGGPDALVSGSALAQDTSMCGEADSGISASQISSTIAVDTPVSKTVTFTIAKALVNAISNNGAPFMSVCMRAPNQDDVTLPDCTKGGVTHAPPCVVSRNKNHANEVIVVSLPAGDPHFNVY